MKPPTHYYWQATKDTVAAFIKARVWFDCTPSLEPGLTISADFFGINIAPSRDPQVDDYIISRLKELGLRHVRMNFSYESLEGDAERLLKKILQADFQVMLDILPPKEDAAILDNDVAAQQRWRDFVNAVVSRYGDQLAYIEIGTTPNRGQWSGFEPQSYLAVWQIAYQAVMAADKNISLAGPNVSDFEPIINISLLAAIQRQGMAPVVHTDNLFVERVIEPEAYDHRVFGRLLEPLFKLNLVKKARIFAAISHRYGAMQTMCTYTCWTSKRLSRWTVFPEQKKVDYLVRYLVTVAVSGALERVYWGPLICSRDGLIDDSAEGYPEIDNVSFYKAVRGEYDALQPEPAFYALKQLIETLQGARCVQAVNADNGLNHFIFDTADKQQLHIAWMQDRLILPLSTLYLDKQLAGAQIFTAQGIRQDAIMSITEHPIFIVFDQNQSALLTAAQMKAWDIAPKGAIFTSVEGIYFLPWAEGDWQGTVAVKAGEDPAEKAAAMLPASLLSLPQLGVHRDQRNKVWSVNNPLDPNEILVVKQNRATGVKKFTYRFRSSKGQRHWNNASEMIRRGVNSPMPIAYFERIKASGVRHNYYVCEWVADAFSARAAFTAFAQGDIAFAGFRREDIYQALAIYICTMHDKGIIHNDLSGGNLLMTKNVEIGIEVTAIDIGRARILQQGKQLSQKQRLTDLARACYKLDWPNRRLFMQSYFDAYGKLFAAGWEKPLDNYDKKQVMKRKLKRLIKRNKKS